MFIQIEDNYLKVNRGDTFILPLTINEGTKLAFKQYQLRQFDKIYVGIMECNQSFENAIIRKVIDFRSDFDEYGRPLFVLDPIDTEYLLTGRYFIEIKLVQKENKKDIVTTILPMKEFFIQGTDKEVKELNTVDVKTSLYDKSPSANWEELTNDPSTPTEPSRYEWSSL